MFRHYWVLAKLLLTVFATIVLLVKMELIGYAARLAAETTLSRADLRAAGIELVVHSAGGLLVLLVPAVLSVYKPRGMTSYGRRQVSQVDLTSRSSDDATLVRDPVFITSTPRWVRVVGIHAIGLVVLFVILHLASGGLLSH